MKFSYTLFNGGYDVKHKDDRSYLFGGSDFSLSCCIDSSTLIWFKRVPGKRYDLI